MRPLLLLNLLLCQSLPGQNCPNDSLFNRFKYDVQIEMLNHTNEISWHDVIMNLFLQICERDYRTRFVFAYPENITAW